MIRQVIMSAGIGDNITALTCTIGLKTKYPQDHIVFSTNHREWIDLFGGWDETVPSPVKADKTYHPYNSYKLELADMGRRTRAEYYADFVDHVVPQLPSV